MDVTALEITPHPMAKELLFKHYHSLRRIFSNVLGQLETDYISISLINSSSQLLIFSSSPSAELNILEKELWQLDKSYQAEFVYQDKPMSWDSIYKRGGSKSLYKYKLTNLGLTEGLIIPSSFESYRAIFSFGFKYFDPTISEMMEQTPNPLLAMGKFCLREIMTAIPLPDEKSKIFPCKPKLKLVINNEVNYGNSTR